MTGTALPPGPPPQAPPGERDARDLLRALFDAAVAAVTPAACLTPWIGALQARRRPGRLAVLAVGKAGASMLDALADGLDRPVSGLVITPPGYGPAAGAAGDAVARLFAGHPTPDAGSLAAGEGALALAAGLGDGDHLLALVSGGGSALMCAPAPGAALADPANESLKPDHPEAGRLGVQLIARAVDALEAARRLGVRSGHRVTVLGDRLEGEARSLGAAHAALALAHPATDGPALILSGGETTVTVTHPDGRGGPNLEYLLALALALDGAAGIFAIACDTDGQDGSEPVAGAVVTPSTLSRARSLGLDAREMLARNDSHAFFAALGDLVVTGPTRTNVNDFRAVLIRTGPADGM